MPDRRRKRPADTWGCGRRRDCDGGSGTRWRTLGRHDGDLPCEHQSSARTNDPFGRLMHHTPRLLASLGARRHGNILRRAAFSVVSRRRRPLQPGKPSDSQRVNFGLYPKKYQARVCSLDRHQPLILQSYRAIFHHGFRSDSPCAAHLRPASGVVVRDHGRWTSKKHRTGHALPASRRSKVGPTGTFRLPEDGLAGRKAVPSAIGAKSREAV